VSEKPSTWRSLGRAVTSWRLGSVTLLSFSSGLPLGLVLTSVPSWMQKEGIDIKTIGLVTAAQAPYAFKFLWSPLMDRFAPRWGRKRAWILFGQIALAAGTAGLALQAGHPVIAAIAALTLFVSFASATQDIAIDAYTVEVLKPEEQAWAVGARTAIYRAAYFIAGGLTVTLGPELGWGPVFVALALLYLPLAGVTLLAPEPEAPPKPPHSLREAIWSPMVGFFRHPRALEITAFILLYKFADNLASALVRPFLQEIGYAPVDVGVAMGTIGLIGTLVGTFIGGILTQTTGMGRALWVSGVLQALSNIGYVAIAEVGVSRPLMYVAMAVETSTSGMGAGALGVLLLRLTERRFSATQYALFSSLFALGRTFSGPPAGVMVDAMGWRDFFISTIAFAVPGMLLLQRFVPWRSREIPAPPAGEEAKIEAPLTPAGLAVRGLLGTAVGTIATYLFGAFLAALKGAKGSGTFDLAAALVKPLSPASTGDWIDLLVPPVAGIVAGLATAAYLAARRGIRAR
jgi:PAT family beta-lactamase induction signal transducer AmpG